MARMTGMGAVLRVAAVAALAGLAVPATAAQADAEVARVYTKGAVVSLVELGPMTGAPGNAHFGHLEFYRSSDGSTSVLGYVFHFDCPAGFTIEPGADFDAIANQMYDTCTSYVDGTESLESGDVQIRMTKDQRWAHVSGYFDSSLQPTVSFSLDFRGSGLVTETETVNRSHHFRQFMRERSRAATVTGVIGGMGIGDEADDVRFPAELQRNRLKTVTW